MQDADIDAIGAAEIAFELNGAPCAVSAPYGERLSETLRERLGARDVKVGCNAGDCGACTVLIDGAPVCACMAPAGRAQGRRIETLAGLDAAGDPLFRRLQARFHALGAAQCGICTPGMLVAAAALLRADPRPAPAAIERALAGVLCRCTGYRKIIAAVASAADAPEAEIAPAPTPAAGAAVGAPVRRLDGAAKLSGREAFGDDAPPADALTLKAVRSPHHAARFALGDVAAWAAARPGVAAVLTARDVPGENRFGVIPPFADQPALAEEATRFKGEAVAIVAGAPETMATLDLSDFPVVWSEEPAALTPPEALAEGAAALHPNRPGNVMTEGRVARGDLEAGFARAAAVAEGRYATAFVEHAYIEPEAGWARRVGDRLEIWACTQAPMMNRDEIAGLIGVAPEQVRVRPAAVGGGFGSKLDLSVQSFLAIAAWRLGRPVRMTYTRAESMATTTKRHPSEITARIGADADGRLTAMRFHGDFNTGAYASWGPTVANRVPIHASGPYETPAYLATSRAVHTNCAPAGAFRGFGVPQSAIAQETLFDLLAEKLGIDPLAFRLKNALRDGAPTVCGQRFAQGVGIAACFEALAPAWAEARAAAAAANAAARAAGGRLRRGAGLAGGWYGCGNTSLPNPSTIKAGLTAAGRVALHQGAVDIGQGANTVIAQIFADGLGAPLDRIDLVGADTDLTPDAGKTSASRQTFVSGGAALRSGRALRAAILRFANAGDGAEIAFAEDRLVIRDGAATRELPFAELAPDAEGYLLRAEESYDPPTLPLDADGQGAPYAQFGYAAHLAELEVDLDLGTVRPLALTCAHDVGRAINPVLVEGQIEGGAAQGLGMALMEAFVPGRTDNLHDYLIPTIGDMPPVTSLIVEEADAEGPFGAKGLGEHALIPTAPAILNAIRAACGARVTETPATPDRVLAAIRAAAREGDAR